MQSRDDDDENRKRCSFSSKLCVSDWQWPTVYQVALNSVDETKRKKKERNSSCTSKGQKARSLPTLAVPYVGGAVEPDSFRYLAPPPPPPPLPPEKAKLKRTKRNVKSFKKESVCTSGLNVENFVTAARERMRRGGIGRALSKSSHGAVVYCGLSFF